MLYCTPGQDAAGKKYSLGEEKAVGSSGFVILCAFPRLRYFLVITFLASFLNSGMGQKFLRPQLACGCEGRDHSEDFAAKNPDERARNLHAYLLSQPTERLPQRPSKSMPKGKFVSTDGAGTFHRPNDWREHWDARTVHNRLHTEGNMHHGTLYSSGLPINPSFTSGSRSRI